MSAAIVGAGAYAVKAMDEVDVGLDTLATKTGATGETAKDLQEVYKQVAEENSGRFRGYRGCRGRTQHAP